MALWWGGLSEPGKGSEPFRPTTPSTGSSVHAGAKVTRIVEPASPAVLQPAKGPGVTSRIPALEVQPPAKRERRIWPRWPRRHPLSEAEHRICDQVASFRRECGLSQLQLARILNTSVREVKRWENHECKPANSKREFLGILVKFVEVNGLPVFLERFVRETPRYRRSGPADRLVENAFDSRVTRESPAAFVESGR